MTWISNQRAWKQVNRIVMSVWILNTQHLENAHTTSMPEASTERLSVRYFYQPKQKISSHPGGYWAKTCMKKKRKTKSWRMEILDLFVTATTNDMIAE